MLPPTDYDFARRRASVIGAPIDAIGWISALDLVARWAGARQARYVCFCNAHSVVTARGDATLAGAIAAADLALPDGMPVAWMMRRAGFGHQPRINGPDFMYKCCALAERLGTAVYFYGSTPATLQALQRRLASAFPGLKVAGAEAPPFRAASAGEDEETIARINASGAGLVFVGLGCPKQELWMAARRPRIRAVMAGVGAAFDYHAGTLPRAPQWMQKRGLEWLHRLGSEPRRLWRRYLVTNTLFAFGALRQLLAPRRHATGVREEPR